MNEEEYYAGEITDSEIQAQADNGAFRLRKNGFNYAPSQAEIRALVKEGEQLYRDALDHGSRSPKGDKLVAAGLSLLTLGFCALAWVTR
jgi:hypothetical protein